MSLELSIAIVCILFLIFSQFLIFAYKSTWMQVTPSQIRDAEKNLQNMEAMIEAMTPGPFSLLTIF